MMESRDRSNIVDEIKSRCNIVDVIGRVVPLKKAGNNYKGICPFHNEKTPSFIVSETKQIFTCFGCGATGDVLEFVEKYYNTDFIGAIEMIAKEYGIPFNRTFKRNAAQDELYKINRNAAMFFFQAMRSAPNAGYSYMKQRGISEEIMNKFGIGFADDSWTSLYDYMKKLGVSDNRLMELGLISHSKGRYYDKFRNRVMFPIINTRGKVIGFGGRIIGEGEPKYLNSQESELFQKKNNLYGLNLTGREIKNEDQAILVEGYMDVISLYQAGVRNVSASLGTALTENQSRLIKRFTKNVILSYDADEAGQKAAFRGLDVLYNADCKAKVLRVTEGKDPDEFIRKNGRQAFRKLADNAVPYGDFKINTIKAKYDLDNEQERIDFIGSAVSVLRGMKPVEADIYIKKLADMTGISEGAIRFEYSGNNIQEKRFVTLHKHDSANNDITEPDLLEQDLIRLMLTDIKYIELPADIDDRVFNSGTALRIYDAIKELASKGSSWDKDELKEILDEKDAAYIEKIEEIMLPPGREDKIFEDCIKTVRRNILREQEAEIITKLSIADEEENNEKIIQFTQQLIEIQQKLKG